MGTLVTVQVIGTSDADPAIESAFAWFHEIEARCTRFSPDSELMQLTSRPGAAVPVSDLLFEAVQFALKVAQESDGAFDPTVGHRMALRGFRREYRTGEIVPMLPGLDPEVSYRDLQLDAGRRTITLHRPLTLDLGAVVKGLAIDLAARELEPFQNFAIDAGGDLYLGGRNEQGEPWSIGIRHPRHDNELIATLHVSNQAVCTSGDYERPNSTGGHHILDPRTGSTAQAVASATVVASGAMLADALATAAFVLGPEAGIRLLDRLGVDGLIVTPDLQRFQTRGFSHAA
jgi:thiamine biosynthesis lipoprotein